MSPCSEKLTAGHFGRLEEGLAARMWGDLQSAFGLALDRISVAVRTSKELTLRKVGDFLLLPI